MNRERFPRPNVAGSCHTSGQLCGVGTRAPLRHRTAAVRRRTFIVAGYQFRALDLVRLT